MQVHDLPFVRIDRHFDQCIEFIAEGRATGTGVYVHCKFGVSRSATIVIAYVMQSMNMKFVDALAFVKKRRSCIEPNLGFKDQLRRFEKKLGSVRDA